MAVLAVSALVVGCGTKEAEDPRKILGDWMQHEGADGNPGARGSAEPRSPGGGAPVKLATRAECRAAARRIEELALELAVREAESPEERTDLEARRKQELKSQRFAGRVERATSECLGRETSAREAQCIAKARSELDIDRCARN